jgi:hypothetical protein
MNPATITVDTVAGTEDIIVPLLWLFHIPSTINTRIILHTTTIRPTLRTTIIQPIPTTK